MSPHKIAYVDGETFSSVDLPNCGLANYWDPAADTGVHCIAVKYDDGPIQLWKNHEKYHDEMGAIAEELADHIVNGGLVVAHKAEFEFYMLKKWFWHLYGREYADELRLQQMRCTMAKAHALGFPPSLGKLALAMGMKVGKHTAGQKAMKILCKPNPATGKHWQYHEAPQLFEDLYTYCIQDVQLEYDIDQMLPDLSEDEQEMWTLDQMINRRGVGVDRRAAAAAYQICESEIARLDREIREVSGGKIDSTKAVIQIARYCGMQSVAKANIEAALDQSEISELEGGSFYLTPQQYQEAEEVLPPAPVIRLTPEQKKVLQIRQEAAKSSVLKLKPMLELCGSDGRVRWTQQFNGAGTGRWGGRNPQPHNFPRGTLHLESALQEAILDDPYVNIPETARDLRSTSLQVVSDCLRGMFVAAPGHEFSSFDFAQIEMRLGAWFVGDEGLMEEFRGDGLVYEFTYASTYGIEKADVTKDQRQEGKTLALGAQFGGGAYALVSTAKQGGKVLSEEKAEELKVFWREAHPNFPYVWKALESAAKRAVFNPGTAVLASYMPEWADKPLPPVIYEVPMAADGTPGCVLQCELPSGRVISYPFPRIERRTVTKKDGTTWETDSLTYMVVDNGQWVRTSSYGGKLFENIVQASAADLLRFGIKNMNDAGVPVVLMVHDEVLTETPKGSFSWESGRKIMESNPEWCLDLPIKVTGWQGPRYRKE